MAKRRGEASIFRLGAWTGGHPARWVRVGAAIAAVGYLLSATFHLLTAPIPAGHAILELLVSASAALAFWRAGRRPAQAAVLLLVAVFVELLVSTVLFPSAHTVTPVVLPVLVLAGGLFLGPRGPIVSAVAVGTLYPIALAASGLYGPRLQALPPVDASRLLVVELCVTASGLLTWLAVRTLARVHVEAEERRQLEIRLQHFQRLEVVGQLAGVAAHDFRNILAIFQNAASILAGSSDADSRELGTDLLQSARSGQEITARLLALARRDEPRRSIIDVARAVEQVRPLATRLLGPRCRLALVAEGPALAVADPAQLEQVVLNLAANARDAMADGGTVSVRVRRLSHASAAALGSTIEATRQVLVEVADQGPGVQAEIRERLFEPFVTTKPRDQGTGLGLATVRSIATGSSGCVMVESAPGGATFRVFLPEAEAPGQERAG